MGGTPFSHLWFSRQLQGASFVKRNKWRVSYLSVSCLPARMHLSHFWHWKSAILISKYALLSDWLHCKKAESWGVGRTHSRCLFCWWKSTLNHVHCSTTRLSLWKHEWQTSHTVQTQYHFNLYQPTTELSNKARSCLPSSQIVARILLLLAVVPLKCCQRLFVLGITAFSPSSSTPVFSPYSCYCHRGEWYAYTCTKCCLQQFLCWWAARPTKLTVFLK